VPVRRHDIRVVPLRRIDGQPVPLHQLRGQRLEERPDDAAAMMDAVDFIREREHLLAVGRP
jgi:hypothetical protein